ncbi:Hypothetical protein GbCGDNIH9_8575 [Granulibacter bethesdensis]|uniref:Uncharacterized protein n=1 Tax=Granulibacter bethesdensis TaxID=364410 RepID=A0AAC9K7W4_9PROT|nr:Hypothetical protein GbCGDNIH9_8575 [Granulibacter bethesdensis]APH62361.1 Hypothetical protein GbCGDNIH8_8575 [Granulibacter bethesdensis]
MFSIYAIWTSSIIFISTRRITSISFEVLFAQIIRFLNADITICPEHFIITEFGILYYSVVWKLEYTDNTTNNAKPPQSFDVAEAHIKF